MSLACIHTHTLFCDGADDVESCCRSAFDKGLSAIGFSAHAPVTKKTGMRSNWHLDDDRLEEYIETITLAKKRWQDRLNVYLGLEVDFIENLMGPSDEDYRKMNLDYIIGSVHYITPQKGAPFTVDGPRQEVETGIKEGYDGDPMGMVEAYWNAEAAMIKAGGFDLLGHADLVKKNNASSGQKLFAEDADVYRKNTRLIAALMAEAGLPVEVNTGGMNRGKIKECYPSQDFLKLFRAHNVPVVINADAHRAEDLDGHYKEAKEALLAAGYTETLLFEGRKNGKAVWKAEKL